MNDNETIGVQTGFVQTELRMTFVVSRYGKREEPIEQTYCSELNYAYYKYEEMKKRCNKTQYVTVSILLADSRFKR